MRKIAIVILLIGIFFSFAKTAKAESCNPIYNAGPACITIGGLILDAKVMNPRTNQMVNNLTINDSKYAPGALVTFQIIVSNSTNLTIPETEITNGFPPYVDYSKGEGNFDPRTRILTFRVHNLEPRQPQIFTVVGKIADPEKLPAGNNITCVTNQAVGIVLDPASAKDTSRFCIEKRAVSAITPSSVTSIRETDSVEPEFPVFIPSKQISKTPSTGLEILTSLGLIATGFLGHILRQRAKRV